MHRSAGGLRPADFSSILRWLVSGASHIDYLPWSRYIHYHDFNSELRSLGRIAWGVTTAEFERSVERGVPDTFLTRGTRPYSFSFPPVDRKSTRLNSSHT